MGRWAGDSGRTKILGVQAIAEVIVTWVASMRLVVSGEVFAVLSTGNVAYEGRIGTGGFER